MAVSSPSQKSTSENLVRPVQIMISDTRCYMQDISFSGNMMSSTTSGSPAGTEEPTKWTSTNTNTNTNTNTKYKL